MGDGRWAMGDGRWAMVDGRWSMVDGRWAMGDGKTRHIAPELVDAITDQQPYHDYYRPSTID